MQNLIIREGYYECPSCKMVFKVEQPNPQNGDGYCDECEGSNSEPVRLRYLGSEPPDGCDE
jgi:hypothetical protein